ncbi:MAG: hypothetical protein NTY48_00100 [Candidatus Diapherotrites archaeon]|nr:hypothetical protein [Candidatus Diapherotrites archaeon]
MGSLSKLVLLAIFIFALFAGAILVIYQNQSTSDSEIKIIEFESEFCNKEISDLKSASP